MEQDQQGAIDRCRSSKGLLRALMTHRSHLDTPDWRCDAPAGAEAGRSRPEDASCNRAHSSLLQCRQQRRTWARCVGGEELCSSDQLNRLLKPLDRSRFRGGPISRGLSPSPPAAFWFRMGSTNPSTARTEEFSRVLRILSPESSLALLVRTQRLGRIEETASRSPSRACRATLSPAQKASATAPPATLHLELICFMHV